MLLMARPCPDIPEMEGYLDKYRRYLVGKLEAKGAPTAWLKSASIELYFLVNPRRTYLHWGEAPRKCNISISLESNLGRRYFASSFGYSVSHNPQKEQRRVHF